MFAVHKYAYALLRVSCLPQFNHQPATLCLLSPMKMSKESFKAILKVKAIIDLQDNF